MGISSMPTSILQTIDFAEMNSGGTLDISSEEFSNIGWSAPEW